jgi:hypothetical protein
MAAIAVMASMWIVAATASAEGSLTVTTCGKDIFTHNSGPGFDRIMRCPPGTSEPPGISVLSGQVQVTKGTRGSWQANAPAGLLITGASIPPMKMYSRGVSDGGVWGGGFYWQGGGAGTSDTTTSFSRSGLSSPYFGFQVVCGSKCDGSVHPAQLTVETIDLQATETQGPTLSASSGLWQASGWVAGNWPLTFAGDSPSGVCSFTATLAGSVLTGPTSARDDSVWHQCAASPFQQTISTAAYGQGAVPLTLTANDAAGVTASVSKTLYVDNVPPTISLSGPSDAPTTAGTQFVTATATAGPSGVGGITCSVDDAPAQTFQGASVRLPVQGLGVHTVTCTSTNNASDPAGTTARSAPASWTVSIREPTVVSVSFARIVDRLRCKATHARVHVPAHWEKVLLHGHRVRVRIPAQTRRVRIVKCHPRYAIRRVHRKGHTRLIKVPLVPHTVQASSRRVRFGARTTIHGWLGTTHGLALGGQRVRILTAPDNGQRAFSHVMTVRTKANGNWSARLPKGPSRIVEAAYGGATQDEPSAGEARIVVPASVRLRVHPRHAHWGRRIVLSGRLRGGHLPAAGETVILAVRFGGKTHDFAHVAVRKHGHFRYVYTFLPGHGSVSYPFSAETVRESDYPFAPARSRSVIVHVGP